MTSFEEAKKIALGLNSKFNACNEYSKGYHFYYDTEEELDGVEGAVIIKETGKAVNWISFITNYHPEKRPLRKIEL